MLEEIIEYFASTSALKLWILMTIIFFISIFTKIFFFGVEFSMVKMVLSGSEMAHFWIPIVWGKYLYRITKDKDSES